MSVVHTFLGAKPPSRTDSVPWNRVRIEQVTDLSGTWSPTTTQDLSPIDADPRNPQKRDITFTSSLAEGYFRLVFLDASSNESSPTEPVFDDGSGLSWRPSVRDVAAHIRARTKDDQGNELGTFTNETRPTDDQVEELIPTGVRAIGAHIGTEICVGDSEETRAALYDDAQDLAALLVAMKIELTYYPEQVGTGRSPYPQLKELYDAGVKTLIEAVSEHCGGGDGESIGGAGAAPHYAFDGPYTGWQTEW